MKTLFVIGFCIAATLRAQPINARMPYLRATGEGVVASKPDQAKVTLGVTTQAPTAAEASQKNADLATKVQAELRKVLGSSAELRTTGFNLSPTYRSTGQTPSITAYSATNSVEATIGDIALVGKAIDAGIKAGANNVHGIRFLLKDPAPSRAEALRVASKQARSQAEAMAQGLGGRAGRVLSASDSFTEVTPPPPMPMARMAMSAATPVESGNVEVRVSVTIECELINGNY